MSQDYGIIGALHIWGRMRDGLPCAIFLYSQRKQIRHVRLCLFSPGVDYFYRATTERKVLCKMWVRRYPAIPRERPKSVRRISLLQIWNASKSAPASPNGIGNLCFSLVKCLRIRLKGLWLIGAVELLRVFPTSPGIHEHPKETHSLNIWRKVIFASNSGSWIHVRSPMTRIGSTTKRRLHSAILQ